MAFVSKINRIKTSSFFNSYATSKCFELFEVIFLLRFDNLASKSDFVSKFACANVALKTSADKVLNAEVAIYLLRLWSVSFFLVSVIFVF